MLFDVRMMSQALVVVLVDVSLSRCAEQQFVTAPEGICPGPMQAGCSPGCWADTSCSDGKGREVQLTFISRDVK